MKTERDTIFSHNNNTKYSPNDGRLWANNITSYFKLNKSNQLRIRQDTVF